MYRLTLNGAECIQQTWDDVLNRDGWADEIYFTWSWALKNNGAAVTNQGMSSIYGDINQQPNRIQAGAATPNGGIRNGNVIPTMRLGPPPGLPPGVPVPPMFPQPAWSSLPKDGFPITLWQGDLTNGTVLAVNTLVWECDGQGGGNPQPPLSVAANIATSLGGVIATGVPVAGAIAAAIGAALNGIGNILGTAGDRPIGKDLGNPSAPPPIPWPEWSVNEALAPAALTADSGFGPGVYRFQQLDPAGIGAGHYAFYLQFRRV